MNTIPDTREVQLVMFVNSLTAPWPTQKRAVLVPTTSAATQRTTATTIREHDYVQFVDEDEDVEEQEVPAAVPAPASAPVPVPTLANPLRKTIGWGRPLKGGGWLEELLLSKMFPGPRWSITAMEHYFGNILHCFCQKLCVHNIFSWRSMKSKM